MAPRLPESGPIRDFTAVDVVADTLDSAGIAAESVSRWIEDESWQWSCGADTLVAMPVSPQTVYVYWEVDPLKQRLLEDHLDCAWRDVRQVLRVCDVTSLLFDGDNANSTRNIALQAHPEQAQPLHTDRGDGSVDNGHVDNWYVRELADGRDYIFLLGVVTWGGDFLALIQSQAVRTPRLPAGAPALNPAPQVCFQLPPVPTAHAGGALARPTPSLDWRPQFSGYSLYPLGSAAQECTPLSGQLEGELACL